MQKICLYPVLMIFFIVACFPNEINYSNRLFIQIEDTRFYLRCSHRDDVEAFFGQPDKVTFFERGSQDFFWRNFTVCEYEDGMLRFHFREEGDVIRITVNKNYTKGVLIFGRLLCELDHAAVTFLLRQADIEISHASKTFIGSSTYDPEGNIIFISFWFDEASELTWLDMLYDEPWIEEIES